MTSRFVRACVAVATVGVAFGLPSCSHDTLTSSTAGLAVTFVPSPSGTGRFEQASMGLNGVNFVPTDPALAALTPGNSLTLGVGITANLTVSQETTLGRVALAPGTYKVTKMTIVPPSLVDEEASNSTGACITKIVSVPSFPAQAQVPDSYVFDESDGYQFTVRSGQTKLNLKVDVPAMINGFLASFTCQDDCGGGTPCLTTYDSDHFRAVLRNTVSIE